MKAAAIDKQIKADKVEMGKLAVQIHKQVNVKSFPFKTKVYSKIVGDELASDWFPNLSDKQRVRYTLYCLLF